jgi:hypothetical protein
MDSLRILIVTLSAACLLVAYLIVVVLRRPNPGGKRRPRQRVSEAEAQTLARIDAVRPTPSTSSRPELDEAALPASVLASDPASLGRMPDMPAISGGPVSPPRIDDYDRAPPAARIRTGPLPAERLSPQAGWGNEPAAANGWPGAGQSRMPEPPMGTGGAAFGAWPATANNHGPLPDVWSNSTVGRMPGFTQAEPSPPVTSGWLADPTEQRRSGALTRVYAESIQVAYDPAADAIDVRFDACAMRSPAEVALAFRVLLAKVRTVLKPLGRDRAALLVDVAGLEISPDVMPVWRESFNEFLMAACEQPESGRFLIARYNSRTPSGGSSREAIQRIQNIAPAVAQNLQSSVLGSREEAAALLARLRELAAILGA